MCDKLRCSFCGKTQTEVLQLIAGPTVYICDECVVLCCDILGYELKTQEQDTKESEKEEDGGSNSKSEG